MDTMKLFPGLSQPTKSIKWMWSMPRIWNLGKARWNHGFKLAIAWGISKGCLFADGQVCQSWHNEHDRHTKCCTCQFPHDLPTLMITNHTNGVASSYLHLQYLPAFKELFLFRPQDSINQVCVTSSFVVAHIVIQMVRYKPEKVCFEGLNKDSFLEVQNETCS